MARLIDRTKQSNCVCKNCRAWSWWKKCYEPRSPKYGQVREPRNTCMLFGGGLTDGKNAYRKPI